MAPAAAHAERYRGQTSQQGSKFELRTNAKGAATRGAIDFRAPCQYGGGLKDTVSFIQPLDRSNARGFEDTGFFTATLASDADVKARIETTIEGKPRGERGYAGTFRLVGKLTKDGDYFSTCRTGLVRWSARAR